ncbi:hypothetical protein BH10PLA2_BH10PLA2_20340 [soil metagenome]
MPRKSKAAKLAESVAAAAQAEPRPFAQQDPYTSPIGRDAGGRFPKGNAGGPGNPHARHCANMLTLFRSCIDAQRLEALIKVLYDKAYAGDLGAIKLIVSYSIGKPTHAPQPDGIEHDEWKRFQESAVRQQAITELLSTLPSNLVNDIVRTTWPAASISWAENLGRQLQGQATPADEGQVAAAPEEKSVKTILDAPEEYEAQVQEFEAALANLKEEAPISNGSFSEEEVLPPPAGNHTTPRNAPISNGSSSTETVIPPASSKTSTPRAARTKPISNGFSKNQGTGFANQLPARNLPPTLPAQSEPIPNGKFGSPPTKKPKPRRRSIDDVAGAISK